MSTFVEIALPVPLRRNFSYRLPENIQGDVCIGARVKVPFGPQQLIGLVLSLTNECDVPENKIKFITAVLDDKPLLPSSLSKLCDWAAGYYFCSHGQMLSQALPVALRKGADSQQGTISELQLTHTGLALDFDTLKRSPAQKRLLETLKTQPLTQLEFNDLELSKAALKATRDKGWVEQIERQIQTDLTWRSHLTLLEAPHRLNKEQAVAVATLSNQDGYHCSLLEGVTGSGKTEVYLAVLESVLKQGKQALILVPEIGLTPQTISRFKRRFDVTVAVMHSALTDKQRLEAWQLARSGEAVIIIGTRSALFSPMPYPGIIILDEEHDSSFKQQEGVKYHARDLAVMRGHIENIPVILGSATPSLETLQNALNGRYQHLSLTHRAGVAEKVRQGIIDIRNQPLKAGMSAALINEIRIHLDSGNQVLLFLNRRGFSPALLCHECGHLHECDRCDAFFTVHQGLNEIRCHHCGNQYAIPKQCHQCGSTMLIGQGIGTEQLEQALQNEFPNYPVVRIDRDSTRRKGSLESHLNAIHKGEFKILVGTQMLAKGHHFPDVTLVGLLDVDGALFSADFRAPERFGQLYTQVAGRAGRATKPGTVLLQTHQSDNPLLRDLLNRGYGEFARSQLNERQQALLPPAWHMVLIRAEAHNAEDADAFLHKLGQLLPQNEACEIIGPMPAPMDRKAGKFRRHLMFQCKHRKMLQQAFSHAQTQAELLPEAKKCRWSIDRDPQDLL
ncbi:primosomal protein N' [Parashewanella spongiae]|uniref:Replication restart protein PriA n=1 Tax=Parashewanella spongiae TaxID=342950 RepID=A0A3A6UG59_9GAMM|nr:primosomal protein N' [Parashewanella spongiae]MCL1078887.1 primosomal protein N' [Parashewanella spongiae]RJY17857.1 primosomal protein N' [Parashewanella spongiae]